MTDRTPMPPRSTSHAEHDLLLVAGVVDPDPTSPERLAAEHQMADCPSCAELAADLRSIALATAALPAAERTRDFTLRPEQAARLRPRGWRRLAASFGPGRLELLRPLGAGLATLGIAGLLLATLPGIELPMMGVASGPAPAPEGYSTGAKSASGPEVAPAASAAPAPVGSAAPVPAFGPYDESPASSAASGDTAGVPAGSPDVRGGAEGGAASSAPVAATDNRVAVSGPGPSAQTNDQASHLATPGGVDLPLAAASAACLALGVSLLALRRATRGRARAG